MRKRTILLASAAVAALYTAPAYADDTATAADQTSVGTGASDAGAIIVTARRRQETSQEIPLAISVVGGEKIDSTGSFNVGRLQQLTPTLQFYSSNPRNTAVNIRGLGVPFGLTSDGFEQGVGIYIDDVYYARVAATTLISSISPKSKCCAARKARSTARTPRLAPSTSRPISLLLISRARPR